MRILFVTTGTRGDALPLLVVAARLRERGHDVTFAAHASQRAAIEGASLDHVPLAGEPARVTESERARELLASASVRGSLELWNDALAGLAEPWSDALEESVANADVVASGLLACVVPSELAAAAKRAHAVLLPFPFEPPWLSARERFFHPLVEQTLLGPHRSWLEARRGARGAPTLGRTPTFEALRADGAAWLGAWSAALFGPPAAPSADAPLGAPAATPEEAARFGLPALEPATERWLSGGAPPLFVGFGSIPFPDEAGLVDAVCAVASAVGMRVVAQGAVAAPIVAALGDDRALALGPCDHGALLPRCAAAMHHAGAGTTHAVARAGVPSIACPILSDQFLWAARVEARGIGASLPARQVDTESLARTVERALAPTPRRNARALGDTLRAEDGAGAIASRLEELGR